MKRAVASSILVSMMLLAVALIAEAQQPKKIPRIGYLSNGNPASESPRAEAIRLALRELGHIEGQNIATEYLYAEGKPDRYPEIAAELVRRKVDIIVVAGGSAPARAAKNATKIIPIVMVGAGVDPVEAGLVESLAHPGGNVTGITALAVELGDKRLELLKEAVPKLARVAVLYNPTTASAVIELKNVIPVAARALGLTVQAWEVRNTDDLDSAFVAMGKEHPHGLYVTSSPVFSANRKRLAGLAIKSRLPSVHITRDFVDDGGLMSYAADLAERHRRVAVYVDRIIKGAKPADLPVEQPTKFELAINLKTAKQIGLTIPPNVLARADKVIK